MEKHDGRERSDRSSSVANEAHMSWSDSQTCVDIKTDRTSRSHAPLLRDVPSHRRVAVLWKGINAYVPVFNAHPTWKQNLGLEPKKKGQSKQVQVGAPTSSLEYFQALVRRIFLRCASTCGVSYAWSVQVPVEWCDAPARHTQPFGLGHTMPGHVYA